MSAQLDPPTPATDWTLCPGQEVRGFCLICLPPPTFSFLFFFFFHFLHFVIFALGWEVATTCWLSILGGLPLHWPGS